MDLVRETDTPPGGDIIAIEVRLKEASMLGNLPAVLMKCCGDHVEAAKAGHLECLARLQEDGHFLGLNASERETAGEARKAQVWYAATAACEAGHAHVLEWLFADGWPAGIDAEPSWEMHDIAPPLGADLKPLAYRLLHKTGGRICFFVTSNTQSRRPPALRLYCAALKTPNTTCLEALLNAGCRSDWICPLAALEGRVAHLILAAERGCVCDIITLHEAVRKGHLLALKTADRYANLEAHAQGQAVQWNKWNNPLLDIVRAAALGGQEDCLRYLLDTHQQGHGEGFAMPSLLNAAVEGGHLPVLKMVYERGRPWGIDQTYPVSVASRDCLHYLLDRIQEESVDESFMVRLLSRLLKRPCGAASIQALYGRSCLPRSPQVWPMLERMVHPLVRISPFISWACLKVVVENSGPPPRHLLCTASSSLVQKFVFGGGDVATLQYVRELGAPWDEETLRGCRPVPLDFLRYAHENGCPWGDVKLSRFARDLETLRYAHVNGCPYDSIILCSSFIRLDHFPLIRYICEHTDPAWAEQLLVKELEEYGIVNAAGAGGEVQTPILFMPAVDWQVALYLVKWMGRARVGALAEVADVRQGRAAALAECFYGAEKYVREGRVGPEAATWASMARCPMELRHRIASEAHLVLPVLSRSAARDGRLS